eukprot:COSAG05_NODE_3420_length_2077_cov_4.082912_2_plen_417_part_00
MPLRKARGQSGGTRISTISRYLGLVNEEIGELRRQLQSEQDSNQRKNLESRLGHAVQRQSRYNQALLEATAAMHSGPTNAATVVQGVRDILAPTTPGVLPSTYSAETVSPSSSFGSPVVTVRPRSTLARRHNLLPQSPSQVAAESFSIETNPVGPKSPSPEVQQLQAARKAANVGSAAALGTPAATAAAAAAGGDDDMGDLPAGSFAGVTTDPDTAALAPPTSGNPGEALIQEDYSGADHVPHPDMSQLAEEVKSRAKEMETAIKAGTEATRAVGNIVGLEAQDTRQVIRDVTGAVGRLQLSGQEIAKQKQDRKFLSADRDVAAKQLETIGALSQQNPRAAKVYERGLITLQQMQDKTYVEALEKSLRAREERQGDVKFGSARQSQPGSYARVVKQSDGIGRYRRPRFDTSPYYAR